MTQILAVVTFLTLVGCATFLRARLRTPSRRYEGPASVSNVYDRWTDDAIVEAYWGEHLHAGHYGNPPVKKDFIAAKVDFIDEMIRWGIAIPNPALLRRLEQSGTISDNERVEILDVGCGIGGTVRHAAKRWPTTAHLTGITLSAAQARRAISLARAQKVENAAFLERDAMATGFPDAGFDVIWAVESELHMPDTHQFIGEMVRLLKPGGMLLIATWNVRDTRGAPLSRAEAQHVRLLLDEWAHAQFTSISEYIDLFEKTGLVAVAAEDWAVPTQPSWRHAVWEGFRNPRPMLRMSMQQRWRLTRDAYTMLRYNAAFQSGLCQYGMIRGQKALE